MEGLKIDAGRDRGDTASSSERSPTRTSKYSRSSGDANPAHVDEAFAKRFFRRKIVWHVGCRIDLHGIEMQLPGPGTIYVDQSPYFLRPVAWGTLQP